MGQVTGPSDDFTEALSEFFSELMGYRSSYSLHDFHITTAADAAAVLRLRLRLAEHFLARGWTAPPDEHVTLERDGALLADGTSTQTGDRGQPYADLAATPDTDLGYVVPVEIELQQMRRSLESRAVIEQAKGIAMERYGLTEDKAWSWLVRTSQQNNEKLRHLAQRIVESTEAQPDARRASQGDTHEPGTKAPSTGHPF